MSDQEGLYPCVGICMADPDSGYCLGCGRPPLPLTSEVVVEEATLHEPPCDAAAGNHDPDTPKS